MDLAKLNQTIRDIAAKMQEQRDYLTELDNVIGDGDHGINLSRGFAEVVKKLDAAPAADCGALLKSVGMTLVSTVGGASGPLYGTAFMKAGAAAAGKAELDGNDFLNLLTVAIDGIQMRGKATQGEKTMLDALIPAREAIQAEFAASGDMKAALDKGIEAAWKGVEYTKTIIATKGRASYLGERSIGHQDPGATSMTMLLEQIRSNVA